jgi:hypothetical protein
MLVSQQPARPAPLVARPMSLGPGLRVVFSAEARSTVAVVPRSRGGEVVFLCIASARRELPLLPLVGRVPSRLGHHRSPIPAHMGGRACSPVWPRRSAGYVRPAAAAMVPWSRDGLRRGRRAHRRGGCCSTRPGASSVVDAAVIISPTDSGVSAATQPAVHVFPARLVSRSGWLAVSYPAITCCARPTVTILPIPRW